MHYKLKHLASVKTDKILPLHTTLSLRYCTMSTLGVNKVTLETKYSEFLLVKYDAVYIASTVSKKPATSTITPVV